MTLPSRWQFKTRHLLLGMLILAALLAWIQERQRRYVVEANSVPRSIYAPVQQVAADMSWLHGVGYQNQMLKVQLQHLQSRLQQVATGAPADWEAEIPTALPTDQVLVQQLPSFHDPLTWKFDVYVPPGSARRLAVLGAAEPLDGHAGGSDSSLHLGVPLKGRSTLEVVVSVNSGVWRLEVNGGARLAARLGDVTLHGEFARFLAAHPDSAALHQHPQDDQQVDLLRLEMPGEHPDIVVVLDAVEQPNKP